MPYKDKEKQKKYFKDWRNRHKEYIKKYHKKYDKKYKKEYNGHIGIKGIKLPEWYNRRVTSWKNRSKIKLLPQYRTYWEMYALFYIRANKQCEICHKPLRMWYSKGISPEKYKDMETANLDHDHKSGLPRGILCTNCNYVIGIVEKRLNGNAKNISTYIKKFNSDNK